MAPAFSRPLSAIEMAVVEQNAVARGVTLDALMENAGRAAAEEAVRHLPPAPARVAVVASTGNNGGDGTCAAHYLLQFGFQPEVWLVRPPSEIRSGPALRCFERIADQLPVHVGVPAPDELRAFPLVLDALLGTGQSGPLRPPIRDAVDAVRQSGAPTLAIDLPTGTGDPHGLRPRWTVTLTVVKREMDAATAGEVTVRDIGIPTEAWAATGPGEFLFFRPPDPRSARGRAGRLIVIGGGPYAGAPALAALSALRSGAERATVLAPAGAAERIQGFSPNLIVVPFGVERFRPTDVDELLAFVRSGRPSAIAVGMGAGAHPETVQALGAVERALAGELPLVVDADGLAALPRPEELPAAATPTSIVATPNAGEFVRYFHGPREATGDARREAARSAAAARRLTLVVKGPTDLITDGADLFENPHHTAAMTVGGLGDVLAGVLASQLAQGVPALHAARLATYWVGEAGLRAAATQGWGLVATDVIERLPTALAEGAGHARPESG
ncbi:MAG TPA: NAD(P)H-hydrate dehydratase [Thermoplasmata archaeon]|nr:NAD(P)H-hydrate dehydratase [Thermoplasmata archaeon]